MAEEAFNALELDESEFVAEKAAQVRILMRRDFPVPLVRKLKGPYAELVNYYVHNRFLQYEELKLTYEDLAELLFEDFQDWLELDFKLVESRLLRQLRNHLQANGIAVEKRTGLPIARALASIIAAKENIPFQTDRSKQFTRTLDSPGDNSSGEHSTGQNNATDNGSAPNLRHTTSLSTTYRSGPRLTDVTKCVRREHIYCGLPDEDFQAKRAHFDNSINLVKISEESEKLDVLHMFLGGQAALLYRTEIKHKVSTVEEAFKQLSNVFLTDEARRANDAEWETLNFAFCEKKCGTSSKRKTLRHLFEEIERLRSCTSAAATATEETMKHITRAKLLSSVSGVECFKHVRASPPPEYLRLRAALYDAATQADTGAIGNSGQSANTSNTAFYTDRKFQKRGKENSTDNGNTRYSRIGRPPRYRGNKNCWVCGKENCHSSNHSRNERKQKRGQFQSFLSAALDSDEEEKDSNEVDDEIEESSHEDDSDASVLSTTLHMNSFLLKTGANPILSHDFLGVALDTCCTHFCTVSEGQYFAYCRYTGQKPAIDKSRTAKFNTSGGKYQSMGTAKVVLPFGNLATEITVVVHIFSEPSKAPLLLSYKVMKERRWNINIADKRLECADDTSKFVNFVEHQGMPIYRWHPSKNCILTTVGFANLYNYAELRNIHRRTGHQSSKRLMKYLERHPNVHDLEPDTRAMLERIVRSCKACQLNAKEPERFRFVLHEKSRFNHVVIADIMKISDGNVLHVMCEGTKYQLGIFVAKLSAQAVWQAFTKCWTNVLSGSPDIIRADAGRHFDAKLFRDHARASGVFVEIVPTEAHHKIGMLERQHGVVRRVYEKLKIDDPSMEKELRLSLTFRCVNDSAGINGLVPTLLVFGTYPKLGIAGEEFAPTTLERAKSIREATSLAETLMRDERIKRAAKSGPTANSELIDRVKHLERDEPVLVYRERKGWQGPFEFIAADDHGAWIRNEHGNEIRLSLHVIKPYVPESWSMFAKLRNKVFEKSRQDELDGLFNRRAISIVDSKRSYGHRLYHGRWIERIKDSGVAKSRMVVCATNENLKNLTHSPTVQRISTRLGFAFASCRPDIVAKCRDIKMAFIQSDTKLRRPVFVELPHELKPGNRGKVLMVEKPLYGLPESPLNWFSTYASHLKNELKMESSAHDPCFLRQKTKEQEKCDGIMLLQVDDTLTLATEKFHEKVEIATSRFENHGAVQLTEKPISHNGALMSVKNSTYLLDQSRYIRKVKPIPSDLDEDEAYKMLRSQNASVLFPACLTRPDLLCHTSRFSQVTREKFSVRWRRSFNTFVRNLQQELDVPLQFVPLDSETAHVAVYTDASFSTTEENKSQLGIIVVLRDAKSNANLIHASSVRAKRRARSVLSAEILALMDGFDAGFVIRNSVSKLLGKDVELHLLTDSRSAYHIATTLVSTREKRLMLDVHLLREAYEKREVTKISWISGATNIADCCTKKDHNGSLLSFIKSNTLEITYEGWVDRDPVPVHAIDNEPFFEGDKTLDDAVVRFQEQLKQNQVSG